MNRQIRRLGFAIAALFALLFAQLSYVQVFAADRIANDPANAARQYKAEYSVQRGAILASNGLVLARSVEAPEGSEYKYVREYPLGDLYGQITGYYSRIYSKSALESSMNAYLAGSAPELAVSNFTDLILGRPKKGGTIVTTIVPAVQEAARRALGNSLGAVAAVDPGTGAILALYSNPGYDPTVLSSGTTDEMRAAWTELNADPEKPLLSKAFGELYLPGSSFKIVTASAAIQNGYPPESSWPNPHVLDLPTTDDDLHNFGDEWCNNGNRTITMTQAFIDSCNVTFGEIGLTLGADKLQAQARAYGFCPTLPPNHTTCLEDTIGFELPFETGRFPLPAYFEQRTPAIAYSAVGLDNDQTNPLQQALVAAAVANGGRLMNPYLVQEVRDPQGRVIKTFGNDQWGQPISEETAGQMRQLMVDVVQSGTGTAAAIPGVTVAGKTGTAANPDGPPNAWFTAFAPAGPRETAQIAVGVIVLDGGSLGNEATGGRVAAPIAADVIRAYLATERNA